MKFHQDGAGNQSGTNNPMLHLGFTSNHSSQPASMVLHSYARSSQYADENNPPVKEFEDGQNYNPHLRVIEEHRRSSY